MINYQFIFYFDTDERKSDWNNFENIFFFQKCKVASFGTVSNPDSLPLRHLKISSFKFQMTAFKFRETALRDGNYTFLCCCIMDTLLRSVFECVKDMTSIVTLFLATVLLFPEQLTSTLEEGLDHKNIYLSKLSLTPKF